MHCLNRTTISTIGVLTLLAFSGCTNHPAKALAAVPNPVDIKEWQVPWDQTRPRDPYLDRQNRVWFVGQGGDYLAVLDPEVGQFHQFKLDPGTGPHNLIVDDEGQVWYAGNRAAHIGKLDPVTGNITKYSMPDPKATDPAYPGFWQEPGNLVYRTTRQFRGTLRYGHRTSATYAATDCTCPSLWHCHGW